MIAKKIDAMHSRYGVASGKCKNCPHYYEFWLSRKYRKCKAYGLSHSEATDWHANYTACGLIDKPLPDEMPVFEQVKYQKEYVNMQCEGQIGMEI